MTEEALNKLKFPIGLFEAPGEINQAQINDWIGQIAVLPELLKHETKDMNTDQLDTPYRPGGWSSRQVVHHLVDSHLNAYIRFKLAMTEEEPTIRPYYEDRWAELPDAKLDIKESLSLLTALHTRWTIFLRLLSMKDLERKFVHPEHGQTFRLDWNIGNYAWHGSHHLQHIITLKKRMNWS